MANVNIVTPATRASNSKLIDPGIKKIWFDEYKQLEPKLEKVLKVESMSTAYEDETNYAGLGEVPEVAEGETYTEDAILHTYDTTYTAGKRGFLIPVSYELDEDQLKKVQGQTKTAARAVARTVEKLGASMLVNGYDTSYTSYGDSKPLFSVSHTRADGGTAQSNASSTGITLTDANLETGILSMRDQLDDRGNMIEAIPNVLLVPPALEKEAIIITKSDKRSGTADNDKNVNAMTEYTGGKLNVIVWDYLGSAAGGSDTAWYLLGSDHKLMWKWRIKPRIEKLNDSVGAKNDIYYWKARFRSTFGWSDWRCVWGSKGDGQAYAS